MGSGTISYKKLPSKKKVYGDADFHIRPLSLWINSNEDNGSPTFLIRKETDKELLQKGYVFQIEGEFGIGESSLKEEKKDIRGKTVYYQVLTDDFKEDFDNIIEEVSESVFNLLRASWAMGLTEKITLKSEKAKKSHKLLNKVFTYSEFNRLYSIPKYKKEI